MKRRKLFKTLIKSIALITVAPFVLAKTVEKDAIISYLEKKFKEDWDREMDLYAVKSTGKLIII